MSSSKENYQLSRQKYKNNVNKNKTIRIQNNISFLNYLNVYKNI